MSKKKDKARNENITSKVLESCLIEFFMEFIKKNTSYSEDENSILLLSFSGIEDFIEELLSIKSLDGSHLVEIKQLLWSLVIQGKIVPFKSSFPFGETCGAESFSLTPEGRQWLKEISNSNSREIVTSPDVYFERLISQKITLGNISQSYLIEAVNCYYNNCPRASMVMVGVSLEALFDELDYAISITKKDSWSNINLGSKGFQYSRKLQKFQSVVEKRYKDIREITGVENARIFLSPMLEHIRQIRNDGAHAALPNHDMTEAYAMLELFTRVAKIMCRLRDYLLK